MIQLFPEYMNVSLVELVHYHVTPGLGYQKTIDYYQGLPEYLLVQLLEVEPDRAFSTGQFSKTLLQEGLRRITEGELLESDLSANARGFIIYH